MVNSKQKGKQGEREFAHWMNTNYSLCCRRGVQYQGTPESPDVVGLDGIHVEVKRTERFEIWAALAQANADCGYNVPIVATRRNRGTWAIVIEARCARAFAEAFLRNIKLAEKETSKGNSCADLPQIPDIS